MFVKLYEQKENVPVTLQYAERHFDFNRVQPLIVSLE
jgi:hypothetical protein